MITIFAIYTISNRYFANKKLISNVSFIIFFYIHQMTTQKSFIDNFLRNDSGCWQFSKGYRHLKYRCFMTFVVMMEMISQTKKQRQNNFE